MPLQSPKTTCSSPISLSSWPITKYSYSACSLSNSTQPPWTHFAHRDNVFLVIDTQRVPGYIQNDGQFSDQQTRLKIIWGLETLESLDLTSLAQQATPTHDLQQTNKIVFIVLGRSPSLAIKYLKTEDQTIRRFQIKFLSDTAYQAAAILLERAKCPVGTPSMSRDETRHDLSSRIRPPFPNFNNIQVQHTPPGTSSGYSNTSGTTIEEHHSSQNSFSFPQNTQMKNHGRVTPVTVMPTAPREFREPCRDPQAPTHPDISYSYLPDASDSFLDDLPPPRPPPFGNKVKTIAPISNLPPLPKPTPLNKFTPSARPPSVTTFLDKEAPKYHEPNFVSTSGFGAPKSRVGAYQPGLPGIDEEYSRGSSLDDRVTFPIFPRGYKKTESGLYTSASSNPRPGTAASIAVDTSLGGKRKQQDDEEGLGCRKKPKGIPIQEDNSCVNEEEFRKIEDFIVNAIHDDDFLKLMERIGRVWQRMGFDEIGASFFGPSG